MTANDDLTSSPRYPHKRPAWWRCLLHPRTSMMLILLAGLAWRVGRYAANWPLWGDEAFVAVNLLDHDFADFLHPPLEYEQIVPLGFLWVELAVARVFGLSGWAVHLVPVLSGVAAFLLTWRLCAATLDRRSALLGVAILAASYYPVRHGVEVKPYAGDMLAGIGLICLGWVVSRRPGSLGRWVALTVAGVSAVWLSLPAAFVGGGVGLFLGWHCLATRRWGGLVPLAIFSIASAASFAWMHHVYAGPLADACRGYWDIPTWRGSFPPMDRPWLIPWWLLRVHAGNMMAYPVGGKHFGSAGTLVLVVFGVASLWRRHRRDLVILLLSPLVPALVAAAWQKYPYGTSARVMLFVAPSFCILAGAGLMALFRRLAPIRARTWAVRVAVTVLILWAVGGMAYDFIHPYKRQSNESARRTGRALAAHFAPGDQVLVGNSTEWDAFVPHYEGPDCAVVQFYLESSSPAPVRWAVPPERVGPVEGTTWVVYYETPEPAGGQAEKARRQAQIQAYLDQLAERLGTPSEEVYTMLPKYPGCLPGVLRLYRFPPAGATTQPHTATMTSTSSPSP